jgi:hypothetical protein
MPSTPLSRYPQPGRPTTASPRQHTHAVIGRPTEGTDLAHFRGTSRHLLAAPVSAYEI